MNSTVITAKIASFSHRNLIKPSRQIFINKQPFSGKTSPIHPEHKRVYQALQAQYLSKPQLESQAISLSEIKDASHLLKDYIAPCSVFEITSEKIKPFASRLGTTTTTALLAFLSENRLIIADAASPRKTGSYKECGAFFAMAQLQKINPNTQTITASAGNHGLGVAYASNLLDMNTTIVVPTTAPAVKKQLISSLLKHGEDVAKSKGLIRIKTLIEHGKNFDEANEFAIHLSQTNRYDFVSPYNNRDVWIGQAYNLYSILDTLHSMKISMSDIDHVLVPVGGGGFASGVGSLSKLLNPNIRVIGVEPRSHAKFSSPNPPQDHGDIVQQPGQTLADGTATKKYGDKTFFKLLECVDMFCSVTEDSLRSSIAFYHALSETVAEGAGALALASVLQYSTELTPKKSSASASDTKKPVVLGFISGKNINPDIHKEIIDTTTQTI